MREILFRGKMVGCEEWAYGDLRHSCVDKIPFIEDWTEQNHRYYAVYPETIGQFTGLLDKNGKRVFEGDIVSFTRVNALGYTTNRVGDVRYYDKLPIFYIMATTGDAWDWCYCENIEVIGTIHDNPELLKGE